MRFNSGFEKTAIIGPVVGMVARGLGRASLGVAKNAIKNPLSTLNVLSTVDQANQTARDYSKRLQEVSRNA